MSQTIVEQLKEAAIRLRREKWATPEMLADEVFAIFQSLVEPPVQQPTTTTTTQTIIQVVQQPPADTGGDTGGNGDTGGGNTGDGDTGGGTTIIQGETDVILEVTIRDIGDNTIQVQRPGGTVLYAVKPYSLRLASFDGQTIDGVSYSALGSQARRATPSNPNYPAEVQTILPSYRVGETIYVGKVTGQVTIQGQKFDYADLNVDARAWAR